VAAHFCAIKTVPEDLMEVLLRLSRRHFDAGISVPGAELVTETVVS
jgi:hypothetical protein